MRGGIYPWGMTAIVRTAIAILGGFLAMTVVVLAGTVGLSSQLVPDGMRGLSQDRGSLPAAYLGANLVLSALAALLGGWVASRMDPQGRWRPVIGLTALVLLMSIANQAVPRGSTGAPVPWYPWAIVLVGSLGAAVGGWLRLRGDAGIPSSGAVQSTSSALGPYS